MQFICIFGVFVADLCFYSEKIPIKGETVLGKDYLVGPGGKGSNQAIAAARLNGKVNFITKMGEDSHADMAFKIYKDAGVITNSITKDKNLSTGVAGIMIDNDGSNAINVVSERESYSHVFSAGVPGVDVLLYARPTDDISNLVLAELGIDPPASNN